MSLTIKQLISEIENDFSTFSESGDIDRISLVRWITNEMKRFGNNILTLHEKVIDIKNSSYTFDENFRSLQLALKVDPIGSLKEGCTNDCLRESFVSNTRVVNPAYFNDITLEYVKGCNTQIVQEVITLKTGTATLCYQPEWLKINSKGIKKEGLAAGCLNLNKTLTQSSPYEVSLTGNTLNCNFSTGTLYLNYYGFETDEEGDILIPENKLGHLEAYLENFCKYKLILGWIGNGRNPGATAQLMQFYKQEADKYFGLAMTDSKFSAISNGDWVAKSRLQNRAKFNRFQLPIV